MLPAQPNLDGLSFDEVLLLATLPLVVAVLVVRYVAGKRRRNRLHAALPA